MSMGIFRTGAPRGFPVRIPIFGEFLSSWGGDGEKYSPVATSGRGSGKYPPPHGFPDTSENTVTSLPFYKNLNIYPWFFGLFIWFHKIK